MMQQVSQLLVACGAVLGFAVSAVGLGGAVSRWWKPDWLLCAPERLALRFLAGAGLLGLCFFLLGLICFTPSLIWCVLVMSAGLNILFECDLPRGCWSVPVLLCGAVLLTCALSGLDRPVGDLGADEIGYHYLGPVAWLREGKISPVPYESLTAFPATVETLFAVVRGISNDRAPGLLCSLFLASLLVQVYGLARVLGADRHAASWGMALFAFMPGITGTVERGFVDVPFAAFGLAAARFVFLPEALASAAFGGLFAGLASGTKYTGLILIGVTVTTLIGRRCPWRSVVLFVGVAAAVGAAWYTRNWIVFGTPIYPPPALLYQFAQFDTFPLSAAMRLQTYMLERGRGLGHGFGDLLLLPFNLTYKTAFFHGGGGIGIGLLALSPIAVIEGWWQRESRLWLIWSLLLTIAWFFTDQELRFLDAPIAVGAAFAGCGLMKCARSSVQVRLLAWAVLAVSIAYGAWITLQSRRDRIRAVLSPSYATKRWAANVPFLKAFDWLNGAPALNGVLIRNPHVPTYYLRVRPVLTEGRWGERVPVLENYTHVFEVRSQACENDHLGTPVYNDPQVTIYAVAQMKE